MHLTTWFLHTVIFGACIVEVRTLHLPAIRRHQTGPITVSNNASKFSTRIVTGILNLQIVQRLPRKLTHSIDFDRQLISIEGSLNPVRDLGSARFETDLVAQELKQSADFLLSLVEKKWWDAE